MKIAINLSIGVQMLAFSESVLLAEKSGIDRKTAIEVLTQQRAMASPMLVSIEGPFVLGLPKEAWFNVNMMQKDTTYALDMGKQLGVHAADGPRSPIEFLTAARGLGLDERRLRGALPRAGQALRSPRMTTATKMANDPALNIGKEKLLRLVPSGWWRSACSRSASTTSTPAR